MRNFFRGEKSKESKSWCHELENESDPKSFRMKYLLSAAQWMLRDNSEVSLLRTILLRKIDEDLIDEDLIDEVSY